MKSLLLCLLLCLLHGPVLSQFSDSFSDGNFTLQPAWQGDSAHFVINAAGQLQLSAPAGSSRSTIVTRSKAIHEASWEWWMRLDFNPSSANYVDVYLVSSRPELDSSLQGYFVRIGNTTDEVSLYRQSGSTRTEIIDGLDGLLDRNSNRLKVRVTRDGQGFWRLESDTTGSGNQYRLEGSIRDVTHSLGDWFGLRHVYSATRNNHFLYDDFVVTGSPVPDTLLPRITSARILPPQGLQLSFNKRIPASAVQNRAAYDLVGRGQPLRANPTSDTSALVEWLLPFEAETWLTFNLGLQDSAGNRLDTILRLFHLPFAPGRLIINEILADATPVVGLPETEMVELFNNSAHPLQLDGWTWEDPQTKGSIPSTLIGPGEFLLLVPPGSQALWSAYGPCVEVAPWPALNNDRDQLWLRNEGGFLSDSLPYERSWLGSSVRQDGGWSLERVSPSNQCSDASNWQGSVAVNGGTPGAPNSRLGQISTPPLPQLQLVRWLGDTLFLHFSTAVRMGHVEAREIRIDEQQTQFQQIQRLRLPSTTNEASMRLQVGGWADCHGQIAPHSEWELVEPQPSANAGLQFSEIYFRPVNGGAAYVELVNTSTQALQLHAFWISSLDAQGEPIQSARLGAEGDLILPQQQVVFTRDTASLRIDFGNIPAQNRRQLANLPTLYTSGGRLVLSHENQQRLEGIAYHDSMHHSQLTDNRGMALEKPQGQWSWNWSSAVFARRGSPGAPNSRILLSSSNEQQWWDVPQEIFSPRMGELFKAQLFGGVGSWMELLVYDATGRQVCSLFPYQALAGTAQIDWDGTGDGKQLLPTGAYVLVLRYTLSSGKSGNKMKRVVIDNLRP